MLYRKLEKIENHRLMAYFSFRISSFRHADAVRSSVESCTNEAIHDLPEVNRAENSCIHDNYSTLINPEAVLLIVLILATVLSFN